MLVHVDGSTELHADDPAEQNAPVLWASGIRSKIENGTYKTETVHTWALYFSPK